MRRIAKLGLGSLAWAFVGLAYAVAEPLPAVTDVEWQPLAAQVKRVVQALELVGAPLDKSATAGDRRGPGRSGSRPPASSKFRPCSIRCAWWA